MAEYIIENLDLNNQTQWEEFNNKSNEGSFFHTLKWKNNIENSFHFKPHYFMIYYNEKVISICPFYENNIKGFKGLMPIPNSDYCHIIIERQHCNDFVTQIILDKAKDISKKNKLSFILFSMINDKIKECFGNYNLLNFPESGNMVLNLKENNPKKIWDVIFSEKGDGIPRKYIRRFERDGITIREVTSIDDLKKFYKYYNENLEFIDKNPYPFSHFENCWNSYSTSDMRITLLQKNDEIYGGLFSFIFNPKKTMYLKYLALNRNISNKYHPPFYLYWDAVLKASEMNLDYVCFGVTSNDINNVTYRTKMKFGSEYKRDYRLIFPLSKLFSISYKTFKSIK